MAERGKVMSEILHLVFKRGALSPAERSAPCKIIVFPGVRIAREEPPEFIFDEPAGESILLRIWPPRVSSLPR